MVWFHSVLAARMTTSYMANRNKVVNNSTWAENRSNQSETLSNLYSFYSRSPSTKWRSSNRYDTHLEKKDKTYICMDIWIPLWCLRQCNAITTWSIFSDIITINNYPIASDCAFSEFKRWFKFCLSHCSAISMAYCKTAVTPVCQQWSYCSLAL